MKRTVLLMLCSLLLVMCAACGAGPEPTEPEVTFAPSQTQPAQSDSELPTEAAQIPETRPSAEVVLVDNEACSFSVTGTEQNEHLGLQLLVRCENKSDRPLMFTWTNVSVCGFMYDPMWAEEVAAGAVTDTAITIDTYALEQMGVASADQVAFDLTVLDSEEFMNEPLVSQSFSIYPTGKQAHEVVFPEYTHTEEETVIARNELLSFIIVNTDDELADYYILNCYISNHSDRNLLISWEDVSVNGFAVNPFWSLSVAAGKQAYAEVIFYRSELEKHDVEVVQDISFRLLAADNDNWEADYLLDEVYTFKPKQ